MIPFHMFTYQLVTHEKKSISLSHSFSSTLQISKHAQTHSIPFPFFIMNYSKGKKKSFIKLNKCTYKNYTELF